MQIRFVIRKNQGKHLVTGKQPQTRQKKAPDQYVYISVFLRAVIAQIIADEQASAGHEQICNGTIYQGSWPVYVKAMQSIRLQQSKYKPARGKHCFYVGIRNR
jgi:hypothetical protein